MFLRYSDSRLGQFERVLRLTLHITQCGSDCIRRPDREGASGDSPDIPGDSVWLNSGYFDGNRGDIHTALEVPDSAVFRQISGKLGGNLEARCSARLPTLSGFRIQRP